MSGKMDFEVTANPDKAIADLSKIINKQDKMIGKLRTQNREAKKTGQAMGDMGSGLGKMATDAATFAAGMVSAQAAIAGGRKLIQLFKDEYADLLRKQKEAAAGSMSFAKASTSAFIDHIGSGGLDKNVEKLKAAAGASKNISMSEAAALYGIYTGARPTATVDEAIGAVSKSDFGGIGKDRRRLVNMVGQIQNLIPDKSTDDAFDIATMLIAQSGERADQLPGAMQGLFKLKAMGADPEKSLARLTHAVQQKQKPRIFSTMATTLAMTPREKIARRPGSGPVDPVTAAKNEIAGKSPDFVMAWADENPEKAALAFGSTWASVAPAFGPGVGSRGLAAMQAAQTGDLYATEVAARKKSGYYSMVQVGESNKALVEQLQAGNMDYVRTGQIRDMVEKTLRSAPGVTAAGRKWAMARMDAGAFFGEDYGDAALGVVDKAREKFGQPTTEYMGLSLGPGPTAGFGTTMIANPSYDPELVKVLDKLADQISRFSAAIDSIENNNLPTGGGLD